MSGIDGAVLTSGAGPAQGVFYGESARTGQGCYGIRRILPAARVRETMIIPVTQLGRDQATTWLQMYDAEGSWLDWALGTAGLPTRDVRGGGLSGVALSLPEGGDALDERGDADDEGDLGEGWVAGGGREGGQVTGGVAQVVPGPGGAGDPAERGAGGAVVGGSRLPQGVAIRAEAAARAAFRACPDRLLTGSCVMQVPDAGGPGMLTGNRATAASGGHGPTDSMSALTLSRQS